MYRYHIAAGSSQTWCGDASAGNFWYIRQTSSNYPTLYWNGSAVATSSATADINAWNHWVISYNGTTVRFWKNGVAAGSTTITLSGNPGASDLFNINYIAGIGAGSVDVVQKLSVYNTAFNADQAANHYAAYVQNSDSIWVCRQDPYGTYSNSKIFGP
jgi:hypothetical protein